MHYKKILVALVFMSILFNCKEAEKSTSKVLMIPIQILENKKAKLVKLMIPNYCIIPECKQGSGNKTWTFNDEIIIT